MTEVVVEYRRSRSIGNTIKPRASKLEDLERRQTRLVSTSKWSQRGSQRNPEQKARWLIRSHGLIEDAINTAYHHMVKYDYNAEEPAFVFWQAVYKWLRRHENVARRHPERIGLY